MSGLSTQSQSYRSQNYYNLPLVHQTNTNQESHWQGGYKFDMSPYTLMPQIPSPSQGSSFESIIKLLVIAQQFFGLGQGAAVTGSLSKTDSVSRTQSPQEVHNNQESMNEPMKNKGRRKNRKRGFFRKVCDFAKGVGKGVWGVAKSIGKLVYTAVTDPAKFAQMVGNMIKDPIGTVKALIIEPIKELVTAIRTGDFEKLGEVFGETVAGFAAGGVGGKAATVLAKGSKIGKVSAQISDNVAKGVKKAGTPNFVANQAGYFARPDRMVGAAAAHRTADVSRSYEKVDSYFSNNSV